MPREFSRADVAVPMPMTTLDTKKPWQDLYQAAVLETNDWELNACILAAKDAIATRLQKLDLDHYRALEERRQIIKALVGLSILEKERLAGRPQKL
jgi:hypothetical protein